MEQCPEICRIVSGGNSPLKYILRCPGPKIGIRLDPTRRHAKKDYSPSVGTILDKCHLGTGPLLKILWCFFDQMPVTKARDVAGVTEKTAVQIYLMFREALMVVAWHEFNKIGKDVK